MNWDEFDDTDAEATGVNGADSILARETLLQIATVQFGGAFAYARGGDCLRINTGTYVVEVRGQSSVTAHGKQGAHPKRIAALRDLDLPVMFLAVEKGAHVGEYVWLGIDEPEIANIDKGTGEMRRQGWRVDEMTRVSFDERGEEERGFPRFVFPDRAPEPSGDRPQMFMA